MQYYTQSGPSLHCESVFTSCDYVLAVGQLSLAEAEGELEPVFALAQISVQTGSEVSQSCFTGFLNLYCHEVFSVCEYEELTVETTEDLTLSPTHYVPVNSSLCVEDCVGVIETECSAQHWRILTNIINELRRIKSIQLPNLQQKSDCNSSLAMKTNCISINTGKMCPD